MNARNHTIILLASSFLAILTNVNVLSADDAPVSLENYVSVPGEFQADMFPEPEYKAASGPFEGSDTNETAITHVVSSDDETTAFIVTATEIPAAKLSKKNAIGSIIPGTVDVVIKRFDGIATVESNKPISQNGLKGQEIRLSTAANNGEIRVRVFLKNKRVYKLVAAGPSDPAKAKQAEQFLSSFRVLNQKELAALNTVPVALEKYVNEAAGFQAMMFPNPEHTTETRKGKGRDANTNIETHSVASINGRSLYAIEITDIPRFDSSSQNDFEFIMDTSVDALASYHEKNAPVKQEKNITHDGMKGRETRMSNPDTEDGVWFRTFFEKGHVYRLIASGPLEILDSKQTDQFFDSFRRLKKKPVGKPEKQVAKSDTPPSPPVAKYSAPETPAEKTPASVKKLSREQAVELLRDF